MTTIVIKTVIIIIIIIITICYFVDPLYWFTTDMYFAGRRIKTTKSDQLGFSRIKSYVPLSAILLTNLFLVLRISWTSIDNEVKYASRSLSLA